MRTIRSAARYGYGLNRTVWTTLNTAVGKAAYALSDRATWLAFQNKADFEIAVEGDKALLNQYGVILVNPARFPTVKAKDGQAFIDWLVSPDGQKTIADFRIDGKQVFFPNFAKPLRPLRLKALPDPRNGTKLCTRAH